MAVDEVLMASARDGRITLRFYRWEPGCLSFGRNQTARGRYDGAAAADRGLDVIRRPTGGRSVYHHRELTYSVAAPADAWGSLRDTYSLINRALAAGLRDLGVNAVVASAVRAVSAPRPTARACFKDPLPGEVTVDGRKLVGSAQWRDRGVLLQHGSLLVHNDQAVVEELRIGGPAAPAIPATGLAELLDPLPETMTIARTLAAAFGSELELPTRFEEMRPTERAAAETRQTRYEDPAWTWRL
jgi:lipoate-protein ligase A